MAIQRIFAELDRAGGNVEFRTFRQWLRDNELWNREESENLLQFLGCEAKPNVTLSDLGRRFLASPTPESQQALLYEWLCGWNPILHKFVFDALDTEGNGHMHSEHELYRVITSYAYPGEYVTLPEFQQWIAWMSATGFIRYVGIRWGLSEKGLEAMQKVRLIDVEDLLEDEEYEKQDQGSAGDDVTPSLQSAPSLSPDSKEESPPASPEADEATEKPAPSVQAADETVDEKPMDDAASSPEAVEPPTSKSNGSGKSVVAEDEEEMPDAPPEAPIPDWKGDEQSVDESTANSGELAPAQAWFRDLCGSGRPSAIELGVDPAQYETNRSLFIFQMVALGRIVSESDGDSASIDLLKFMRKVKFLERYFTEQTSLEAMLRDIRFFRERLDLRQTFRRYAFDLMRYKTVLEAHSGICDRLEQAENVRTLLQVLQDELYETDSSVAPLWVSSEMWAMSLWNNFSA